MKLKMFLGMFCCTITHKVHAFRSESVSMAETIKPCDVSS